MSIIRAALRPTILNMVAKVYIPVLFPLTFLIALLAVKLDALLGFNQGFFTTPTNYYVGLATFILGGVLWLWTYEQLTRLRVLPPQPQAEPPGWPGPEFMPTAAIPACLESYWAFCPSVLS